MAAISGYRASTVLTSTLLIPEQVQRTYVSKGQTLLCLLHYIQLIHNRSIPAVRTALSCDFGQTLPFVSATASPLCNNNTFFTLFSFFLSFNPRAASSLPLTQKCWVNARCTPHRVRHGYITPLSILSLFCLMLTHRVCLCCNFKPSLLMEISDSERRWQVPL